MSEWTKKYSVNGKPVITSNRPGHAIADVLKELQDKAINEIEGSEGVGDLPVEVTVEMLTNQTAKIAATADGSAFSKIDHNHDGVYAPFSEATVTVITGVTAALTTSGTTLRLTLSFTGSLINLETMTVSPATIPDVVATVGGGGCS